MSFFKRLANLFSPSSKQDDRYRSFTVQCNRCGELIQARVDMNNDLSINYGEGEGEEITYFCRKGLVGEQLCFQRIELELTYDKNRQLIEAKAIGGKIVEENQTV